MRCCSKWSKTVKIPTSINLKQLNNKMIIKQLPNNRLLLSEMSIMDQDENKAIVWKHKQAHRPAKASAMSQSPYI